MSLTPGIYAVDWRFGSWKTLIMTRRLTKLYPNPKNIIFTNIKLNFTSPNIYQYDDIIDLWTDEKTNKPKQKFTILEVLELIWQLDDISRQSQIKRDDRIRYRIFADEWWIIFNQHERSKFPIEILQFLLQSRKLNIHLFFWVQKFKNLSNQLREHVSSVFYFRPFLWLPFLKNYFWEIRNKEVDNEWITETIKYKAEDWQWNTVQKEIPIDEHVEYIYKPSRYKYYDDLYLNKKFYKPIFYNDYTAIRDNVIDRLKITQNALEDITVFLKQETQEQSFVFKTKSLLQNEGYKVTTFNKDLDNSMNKIFNNLNSHDNESQL